MKLEPKTTMVITGPSPKCGKTTLAVALVRRLRRAGLSAWAMRPVETRCARSERHDIVGRDGERLRAASGSPPLPLIAPYRFPGEQAPALEASTAGMDLLLEDLGLAVEQARSQCEILLVEGHGAATDPIAQDGNTLNLAQRVGASVIVVARPRLHSVETIAALVLTAKALGLEVNSIVLLGAAENGRDGAEALRIQTGCRVLGPISIDEDDENAQVEALEAALESALLV